MVVNDKLSSFLNSKLVSLLRNYVLQDAFPDDLEDEIEARSNISSAYGKGTPELDSSQVSVTSDILSTAASSNVTTENPLIVVTTTKTRGPPTINRKLEPKSIIAGKLYM